MEIASPFISNILKCRSKMRRLRKKIYKFLLSHKNSHLLKMHKTQYYDIQKMLKKRGVPSFLIRELADIKQKGISFVKKIDLQKQIDIQQIIRYTDKQQSQTLQIYQNGLSKRNFTQQSCSNITLENTQTRSYISHQRILQTSFQNEQSSLWRKQRNQMILLDFASNEFEKYSGSSVQFKKNNETNSLFEICSQILGESPKFLLQ